MTTADDELAGKIEPGVPSSTERFELIDYLSSRGLFTGILLMPVLPFLEDSPENITAVVRKAHEAGASFIYAAFGVTLRDNQREWYYDKLGQLFPERDLAEEYRKRYGERYECRSPAAKRLWAIFAAECEKYGILYRMKDIIHGYKKNYENSQMSLFDFLQ